MALLISEDARAEIRLMTMMPAIQSRALLSLSEICFFILPMMNMLKPSMPRPNITTAAQ